MRKYIESLKQVSWPKFNVVCKEFWITIITILLFLMVVVIFDTGISKILDVLYS